MVIEYTFEKPTEERLFKLFPDDLENDPQVFFHGTADSNRNPIIAKGFIVGEALPSVSFAKNSNLALKYACEKRHDGSPDGCVIAVRFDAIPEKGASLESSTLHIYKFCAQPSIVGYVVIPKEYQFR